MGMIELKLLQDRMNELELQIQDIKKIARVNSNLDIPLNHYFWLQDFKENGDNSYIKKDDAMYMEAMLSYLFSIDKTTGPIVAQYLASLTDGFGLHIKNTFGLRGSVSWETFQTMEDVTKSEEAIWAILENDNCRSSLFYNNTFLDLFVENPDHIAIMKNAPYIKENRQTPRFNNTTTKTGRMWVDSIYLAGSNFLHHPNFYAEYTVTRSGFSSTLYNGTAGPSWQPQSYYSGTPLTTGEANKFPPISADISKFLTSFTANYMINNSYVDVTYSLL